MVARYNLMIKTAKAMGMGIRRFKERTEFASKQEGIKYLELVQHCIDAYKESKHPPKPFKETKPVFRKARPQKREKMVLATVAGLPRLMRIAEKSKPAQILMALSQGHALTLEEINKIAWPCVVPDRIQENVSRLYLEQLAVQIGKKQLPYELVSRSSYGKERFAICQKSQ